MLHELRVENLLLIERAELRLGPGLNVLTGETGAGKTMLAHALDLLLGGRARSGIVRPGAGEAYVEGVFDLDPRVAELLEERLPADAEELVLARRVWADGRTRAYLNGRSATVADLRDVGGALLAFYGQHEHRRLTLASAQLEILDGFCGPEQRERRARAAAAHAELRALERRAEELGALDGARERELDLLEFELREIEELEPERGRAGGAASASASGCATSRRCAARRSAAPRRWRRRAARPAPRRLLAAAGPALEALAGVDPGSTRSPSASARLRSRPRTSRSSCAATARGSKARAGGTGWSRWRSASPPSSGWSASTAARSPRCSRTPRRAASRRDELTGAEAALEEARAALAVARERLDGAAAELRAAPRSGGARALARRSASGSRSWRWTARASRSRSASARSPDRPAPTRSSS